MRNCLNKVVLLKSKISLGSYEKFISEIISLSSIKNSSYICILNVHMLVESYFDKEFRRVVNNADIATPDGMPLVKAVKILYGIEQDRVAGMDLMPDLMRLSEKENLSIYLYGSTKEVLEKIVSKAKRDFPDLELGYYSPPFRELTEREKELDISRINKYNPDFLFVALGCPKQEKWMEEHKNRINSCMIGLGGAFEVYSGEKKRAPRWMQKFCLEWIYRLFQDPVRLWKRYFFTNTVFLVLIFFQIVKVRLIMSKDSNG